MSLPYIFSSGQLIASAQVNANFAAVALTDFSNTSNTGSGNNVLATSPTLTTPTIGSGGALFSGSSYAVTVKASASTTGNYTFTLPVSGGGVSGYVLSTDGNGITSWIAPATGSGLVVGGSSVTSGTNGYILYNNNGVLGNLSSIPVGQGGTGSTTTFTTGSVVFAGASGVYSQNNSNLFWDNSGLKLGVNTAAPQNQIDVVGDLSVSAGNAFESNLTFQTGWKYIGNGYGGFIKAADSSGAITFNLTSTSNVSGALAAATPVERARFDTNGSLLVGTSTSNSAYQLALSANGRGMYLQDTGSAATYIDFKTGSGTVQGNVSYNFTSGYMTFGTAAAGSGQAERMRITSAGDVGIGTSSPATNVGYTTLTINNAATGGVVQFQQTGTNTGYLFSTSTGTTLTSLVSAPLNFGTNSTTRIVITAAGETIFNAAQSPTNVYSVGYLGIPQNNPGANYTGVLSDAGKHIIMGNAQTFTIPANGSVAYPIGTSLTVINTATGAGQNCTIAITTDTMYLANTTGTTGSRTLAPLGMATAVKIASTSWIISGAGLT